MLAAGWRRSREPPPTQLSWSEPPPVFASGLPPARRQCSALDQQHICIRFYHILDSQHTCHEAPSLRTLTAVYLEPYNPADSAMMAAIALKAANPYISECRSELHSLLNVTQAFSIA